MLLHPEKKEASSDNKSSASSDKPADSSAPTLPFKPPAFETIQSRPWMITDLLRLLLVFLSLIVAAGFVLVLLSQPAFDKLAQDLRSVRGSSQPEKIAFLYLGDTLEGNVFRIRGVVRNISPDPLEQLDAAIRLYSPDGSLRETAIVRMNKETIAPDETAEFELVYPNYVSAFASFSVEFKSRKGGFVPHKDMRKALTRYN